MSTSQPEKVGHVKPGLVPIHYGDMKVFGAIIGLTYHECGEVDAAVPFYVAAGRAAANCDLLAVAESQEMIAIVRSIHGDHKQALADLEKLFPLIRALGKYYAASYYDLLNNRAVELGEVGRIAEAEAACAITLASPLAAVHPNWTETRDEIAAKRVSATPSVVAVNRAPEAATSFQSAHDRKSKPTSRLTFGWPVRKKTLFQRASNSIAVTAAITFQGTTQGTLDRVLFCIGPRAPPAFPR